MPPKNLILLVGPPGSGKSTFCHQSVLQNLAVDTPIVYVTTEYGPSQAEETLREKGLGRTEPGLLNFVDAYNETVGVSVKDRLDTVQADCNNLSSIDIAISKLSERIGRKAILLIFDSLTSPYLFNREEILRFMRLCLLKLAAEGNSVVALVDEGCGKDEDLVAMMSVADGIIRMEMRENSQIINVVKHPTARPTRIKTPTTPSGVLPGTVFDRELSKRVMEAVLSGHGGPFL